MIYIFLCSLILLCTGYAFCDIACRYPCVLQDYNCIIGTIHSILPLYIFRITLKSSSAFSLSISSLSFDKEICFLRQRTTCLYDFTVKVNENQIDAIFKALGIYLKLSNKWTKESALQGWFLRRQWIMGNNFYWIDYLTLSNIYTKKISFKLDKSLKLYILWEKVLFSALRA